MADSTAISAQGSTLEIGTGTGGATTTSAIALGNPTILTSTGHARKNGDVVTLASFASTDAAVLNSKVAIVSNVTANTFAVNIDTTGKAITGSAATATPVAYTKIANFKSFTGFDGAANIIDASHLGSVAEEIRPGIPRFGGFSFVIDWDHADDGHLALLANQVSQAKGSFKLTLPDAKVASFSAYAMKVPSDGGVDKLINATVDLRVTGAVAWA